MTSKIVPLASALLLILALIVCAEERPAYQVAMRPNFEPVAKPQPQSQTEQAVTENRSNYRLPGRPAYGAVTPSVASESRWSTEPTVPTGQASSMYRLPGRPAYGANRSTVETESVQPTRAGLAETQDASAYRLPGRPVYRVAEKNANKNSGNVPVPAFPHLAPSAKPVPVKPATPDWERNRDYYMATTVSGQPFRRGFDCSCPPCCTTPCCSGSSVGYVRTRSGFDCGCDCGMCGCNCNNGVWNSCGGGTCGYGCGGCCAQRGSCGEVFPVRVGKCPWESARLIQWEQYAQGEYVGPARTAHVEEYRLRVDDELDLVYRLTREEQPNPYALNVGDEVRVEATGEPSLNRDLLIQPDGTITLMMLGQVHATGLTVPQLRDKIEQLYKKYYKNPSITVTPLRVNSKLDDLRNSVDRRFGQGGQNQVARVTPDGTISLPAVGVVRAQGLTLTELRAELREAYRKEVEGIEVIPILTRRAPRYVYILGEVALPGRYEMTGPTTLMQALAMAGSWNVGAYLKQVVVFRRGHDWRLKATMLDIRPAVYGRQPCPPDEIWLSDSDVIVVPKNPILVADDFIELVFTRGIYGVFPLDSTINFAKTTSL